MTEEFADGWIGRWSPGIGDPTFVGWLTVVLYFAVAWRALQLLRSGTVGSREAWFWRGLVLVLVALGVNKQLDLQSALTELGRILATEQGWYEERRTVQRLFIRLVMALSFVTTAVVFFLLRGAPRAVWCAAAGVCGLLGFVTVRAASFHDVDDFLSAGVAGLRWNWVLEVGSLGVISLGTLLRERSRRLGPASLRVVRQTANPGSRRN